jgi:hypothetical protein
MQSECKDEAKKGVGIETPRRPRKGRKMTPTGRTFTASLKPAWTAEKMAVFCKQMLGVATVYVINHDSDTDEDGNAKEVHTHVMVDYDSPRKISTVANLLEVEPNFIELVKNTKAMLKYLTHQDEPEKHQYSPEEVVTNSPVAYLQRIVGQNMGDKEIARYLMDGRGTELLDVVPASKLRTIQAFMQFDRSGAILSQLEMANAKLERLERFVDNVERITTEIMTVAAPSLAQSLGGLLKIGTELELLRIGMSERPRMKIQK